MEIIYLINLIASWMSEFIRRMYEYFQATFRSLMDWFGDLVGNLYYALSNMVEDIRNTLQSIIQVANAAVTTLVDSIASALNGLWDRILEATVGVLDAVGSYVSEAVSKLTAVAEQALSGVAALLNRLTASVENVLTIIIARVQDVLQNVSNLIAKQVEASMNLGEQLFKDITVKLERGLETLIGGAGSLVEAIGEKLADVREGFSLAAGEVVKAILLLNEETWGPIRDSIQGLFKDIAGNADPREVEAVGNELTAALSGNRPEELRRWVHDMYMPLRITKSTFMQNVFFTILGIVGAASVVFQVSAASAETMMQTFRREYPYQLLGPGDVAGAWRRGEMSDPEALDMIRRQGYSEPVAKMVLRLSDTLPPEIDLFSMFHRGLIAEETLKDALWEKGLRSDMLEPMLKASYVLPPVSDIITMAVREVFTPAVAERFGQFEDYPEAFSIEAKKQGLTDEWAKRYWAAHWALPSPQQGFEMLHRGVIDHADLEMLLKALDVMPFWREPLIKIAYAPFTRVDVRRMHKVGVLSDDDVFRAYQDLGYNAEKATALTEFTKRLNQPAAADDTKDLDDLSRATIIGLYGDGILSRDKAKDLLLGAGYTNEAAEVYLQAEDMKLEREERKAETKLVLEQVKAGVLTPEEGQDKLRQIGLTDREVETATLSLLRDEETKTKLPSKADGEKMVKAGILDIGDYKNLLSRLGYSEKWRDAYAVLLLGEISASKISKPT